MKFNSYTTVILSQVRFFALFSFATVAGLSGCSFASLAPTEQESISIYQSAVRHLFIYQHKFLGYPNISTLYIIRTLDKVGEARSEQDIKQMPIPKSLEQGLAYALSDLPAKVIFVDNFKDVQLDAKTRSPAGNGVIISMGEIKLNKNRSQVYISLYFSPLAATGKNYILEEINGVWSVIGITGTNWSS